MAKKHLGQETVLVISDTQIPFHHEDSLKFLEAVAAKFKPTEIVHIGDEVDLHAFSKYTSNPDGYSPGHELNFAIKKLKPFYKAFPKVKVCVSNHGARVYRKAYDMGLPLQVLKNYNEILEAPKGWVWQDRWDIDDVCYIHGHGFGGDSAHKKAALYNGKSTVIGHHHSQAAIGYIASKERLIFGMNVGSLIDAKAYAFEYQRFQPQKPIISCGVIQRGIPILIPMLLNKNGRWTKRL